MKINRNVGRPGYRYEYQGKWYTAKELGKRFGISPQTVRSRLKSGTPLDEPRKRCYRKVKTIGYRGEQLTFKEIAAITGLSYAQVRKQQDGVRFYSREEIPPPEGVALYHHEGQSKTLYRWAKDAGMDSVTLYARIRRGWSIAEALARPVECKPRSNLLITCDGITDTLSGWAKRRGINKKALYARLYELDWPIERALAEPLFYRTGRYGTRYKRNAKIIAKMIEAFNHPAQPTMQPGAP